MRRVNSVVCLGFLFLSWGITNSHVLGGDNSGKNQANWDRLKSLSPGQEIRVVQNDAKSKAGNFRSVTDEAIVVSMASGEQTISRQSILRVSSKGKGHRIRNAVIVAGIGAGAGAGIGAAMDAHANSGSGSFGPWFPNLGKEVVTPLGAIVGAIVGAVIPSGDWHEIYRAR
jgi:hypothetical protein